MKNSFSIAEISRLAQAVLDKNDKGKEFMLEYVYRVARQAYEQNPQDPVINQFSFAIERLATRQKPGAIISQAEISTIYNEFVRLSANTKFRDVLGFLLPDAKKIDDSKKDDYVRMNRVDSAGAGFSNEDLVSKEFTAATANVFSGSVDAKIFDSNIAKKGAEFVEAEMISLGFKNTDIKVMGGNKDNIVYSAHVDTRNGKVGVAIPVEINSGRALFPSTFVADDCLRELTASNLKDFINKKSELRDFRMPKAVDILTAISIISGQYNEIKEAQFSNIKNVFGKDILDEKKEKKENINVKISGQDMDIDIPSAQKPDDSKIEINASGICVSGRKAEMPPALAHLARDFEDSVLEAASSFGMETVRKGKELVASELVSAGFKNAQVKFGSENNGSVVYFAAINTSKGAVEIEVPVEMKSVGGRYVPLSPAYFAYDGLIEDFTAAKLQRFAINLPALSSSTTVYSSAFTYMTLPELKDEMIKAASSSDYVTCETILDEVRDKFSDEDFKNTVADYHYVLMLKSNAESNQEEHKCSKIIPAGKGSIYPRCGHLLLPLNKVVTDEQGNCRPKTSIYREKLNPVEDSGASISTSKINLT